MIRFALFFALNLTVIHLINNNITMHDIEFSSLMAIGITLLTYVSEIWEKIEELHEWKSNEYYEKRNMRGMDDWGSDYE